MNEKKGRNGAIDLLKVIFTLVIMLYHTSKTFYGGYIAVEFFFIVSGFLMAKSMEKNGPYARENLGTETMSFMKRKVSGIFPYYFAAWILTFLITVIWERMSFLSAVQNTALSFYNIFMLEMAGNYDMGHRLWATWYISAMLLSMLMIYPIRRKNERVFDFIIAPLVFLLFIGYAYQQGNGLGAMTVKYLEPIFMYNGLLRGIAEISLGCLCFRICRAMQAVRFTRFATWLISVVEWLGYAYVLYFAYKHKSTSLDLVLVVVLAISVILTFSEKGVASRLFRWRFFSVLGEFSMMMYFTHEFIKNKFLPHFGIRSAYFAFPVYVLIYFGTTIAAGLLCWLLGKLLIRLWQLMKRCLIARQQP